MESELAKVQRELEKLWAEANAHEAVRLVRREKIIALKKRRDHLVRMAELDRKQAEIDAERASLGKPPPIRVMAETAVANISAEVAGKLKPPGG